MIVEETCQLINTSYKNSISNLMISDVRIGLHLTAIKLSDNSIGIASTLVKNKVDSENQIRYFDGYSPTKIKGRKVLDLLAIKDNIGVISTLKIATLNAISSKIISQNKYKIIEDTDPIDLIDLKQPKTITLVGAFPSYIKKISATNNKLFILELNENSLPESQKKYFVPANEFKNILPKSDIIIITGLSLVNNTIDDLIKSINPSVYTVITGPSMGIIPNILFNKGINVIGTLKITNPELLFDLVSEGGAGYHLFKYCAKKICILNE